jgi:predicted transcriptional regulator
VGDGLLHIQPISGHYTTELNVQQLVENYLDHDAWFRRKIKKSLERLDRGEFLTHEEVRRAPTRPSKSNRTDG